MMIFTIKDSKAETHGNLVTSKNEQTVMREVETLLNEKTEPYYSHPEDFSLWKIGDYDPDEMVDPLIRAHKPVHILSFHHINAETLGKTLGLNGAQFETKTIHGGE